jgi:hypothetical protein
MLRVEDGRPEAPCNDPGQILDVDSRAKARLLAELEFSAGMQVLVESNGVLYAVFTLYFSLVPKFR